MASDPFAADRPAVRDVLGALDDPDCRTIVRTLEEPMTATELSERCDIPQSTLYRKLDRLSDASLLEERIDIREDGRHATRYAVAFEEIQISLDADRSLEVDVERPSTPDERLSELWSEVRRET